MSEKAARPSADTPFPLTRVVTAPILFVEPASAKESGRSALCEVVRDCPELGLRIGRRIVVTLSPLEGEDCEFPEGAMDALAEGAVREGPEYDEVLGFDGVWLLSDGDVPVLAARACGGERPTKRVAEDVVEAFLRGREGDLGKDPPFRLLEDLDDGWAFRIMEEDATSYLRADLKVVWYGTSYDPNAREDDVPAETESPAP